MYTIQDLINNYLAKSGWNLSINSQECVDSNGKYLPWYSYAAIDFLIERLPPFISVFEYGCGYSTLFYARMQCVVKAVETRKSWTEIVMQKAKYNNLENMISLNLLENQSSLFAQSIGESAQKYDLIVIDSINRNECIVESLSFLNNDGCIILDNSDRESYKESFDFLSHRSFKYLNFKGLGPMRAEGTQTTIFYRRNNIFLI